MAIFRSVVSISAPSINGNGSNTFHFRSTSLVGEEEDQLIAATGALSAMYTSMKQFMPAGTIWTHDGRWQEVASAEPRAFDVTGFSHQADNNGPGAASATAQVVTWRSTLSSKSGRGRSFLSPVPTGGIEANGTPTETFRNQVAGAAGLLVQFSTAGTNGAFVVWSPTDNIGRDIISCSVPNEFAVLRSRRD